MDESQMTGSIKPNESIEVILVFSPKEVVFYDTDITFTTQVTDRILRISGEGVEYKLNASALPTEIDLGKLDFCSPAQFNVIVTINSK
jgi:hypothetical protein